MEASDDIRVSSSGTHVQGRHAHAAHHGVNCPDLQIAERRYRSNLDNCSHTLGGDHPDPIEALNRLSLLLFRGRKLAEAEPLYRRALLANTRRLGAEHVSHIRARNHSLPSLTLFYFFLSYDDYIQA